MYSLRDMETGKINEDQVKSPALNGNPVSLTVVLMNSIIPRILGHHCFGSSKTTLWVPC